MRWVGEARSVSGMTERQFELDVEGRRVPGVVWCPAHGRPGPRPLVMAGHGATHHKGIEYILALAQLLVGRHDFAVAAIDGPGHGGRRPPHVDEIQAFSNFLTEWSRPTSTDDHVAEWRAALAALRQLTEVGDGPLGYWGLSMGTIYGLPFVASEPRMQAAVLGLMGLVGPSRDRLELDAKTITCPVLFIQQWDDQMMPRECVFDLFDALGTLDKRLHAHPGEHSAVPAEEVRFSVDFLVRHLAPGTLEPDF